MNIVEKLSFFTSVSYIKSINKNRASFTLIQNLLQPLVIDDLFLKILHYFWPPFFFLFVLTHNRFKKSFSSVLTHIHSEIHRFIEFFKLASTKL